MSRTHSFLIVPTLAVCAFLVARGTADLVAGRVLASAVPTFDSGIVGSAAQVPTATNFDGTRHAILDRNIFDSATGSLLSETPPAPPTEGSPAAPTNACEDSMRLVGAIANANRPEQSWAAIALPSGSVEVYRHGMTVGSFRLALISMVHVILETQAGGECELAMFRASVPPDMSTTPEPPALVAELAANFANDVQQTGPNRYTVRRTLIAEAIANPGTQLGSVRAVPYGSGSNGGVRLFGIRRNDLLSALGLRNGDTLRTINGYDMSDPNEMLAALAALQTADHYTMSILRRGELVQLDYAVE